MRLALAFWALVVVGCTPLKPFEITTDILPDGHVNQKYQARIETEGGYGDVAIQVLSGSLPPGIGFRQDGRDAELIGTPVIADTYLFTVQARDSSYHIEGEQTTVVTKGFAIIIQPSQNPAYHPPNYWGVCPGYTPGRAAPNR